MYICVHFWFKERSNCRDAVHTRGGSSTLVLVLKSLSVKCLTKYSWPSEALCLSSNHTKIQLQWPNTTHNISTTVHAMTKLFVPFCSAQDGESTDINCLEINCLEYKLILANCKNGKILMKCQVYNKGIFINYELLISLECTTDSEWNDVINLIVPCSDVELFILDTCISQELTTTTMFSFTCIVVFGAFCNWWKSAEAHYDSACAWSTKLGAWTHDWCTLKRLSWLLYYCCHRHCIGSVSNVAVGVTNPKTHQPISEHICGVMIWLCLVHNTSCSYALHVALCRIK